MTHASELIRQARTAENPSQLQQVARSNLRKPKRHADVKARRPGFLYKDCVRHARVGREPLKRFSNGVAGQIEPGQVVELEKYPRGYSLLVSNHVCKNIQQRRQMIFDVELLRHFDGPCAQASVDSRVAQAIDDGPGQPLRSGRAA